MNGCRFRREGFRVQGLGLRVQGSCFRVTQNLTTPHRGPSDTVAHLFDKMEALEG